MSRTTMSVTGAAALAELIENGWFERRSDGWCFYNQRPASGDMERFIYLIKTLGAYSVKLSDEREAPIAVTRGGIAQMACFGRYGEAMKHTPEPWAIEKTLSTLKIHTNGGKPAVLANGSDYSDVDVENARLIKAAPELLSVVKSLLRDVECYCPNEDERRSRGFCVACEAKAVLRQHGLDYADR